MPLLVGSNASDASKAVSANYGAGSDGSGNLLPNSKNTTAAKTTTATTSSSKTPAASTKEVDALLAGSNLTEDERAAIRAVYDAVAEGDAAAAKKMVANLELAKAYADPMLARQLAFIQDDLTRTAEGMDYDLEYSETQLTNRLNDLREDASFQKDQLSLDLQQELKDLEVYLGNKLQETRDTMAARGFTQSTRRAKKEDLLNQQVGDLKETAERKFGAAVRNIDETLGRSERDTALELQRLQDLTERGKIDLVRQGEQAIGTEGVKGLDAFSGIDTLGEQNNTSYAGDAQLNYQKELASFI